MKNSNDTIGNRTRFFQPCSAMPQPTALQRGPKLLIDTDQVLRWIIPSLQSTTAYFKHTRVQLPRCLEAISQTTVAVCILLR